jgi:hypothetical protein
LVNELSHPLRVSAPADGERALPELEPRLAVALVVELEPQVHAQWPGRAGHAGGLHLARQQFVLHHLGERRVDRTAHIRAVITFNENATALLPGKGRPSGRPDSGVH